MYRERLPVPSYGVPQAGVTAVQMILRGQIEGVRSQLREALIEGWARGQLYMKEQVNGSGFLKFL